MPIKYKFHSNYFMYITVVKLKISDTWYSKENWIFNMLVSTQVKKIWMNINIRQLKNVFISL